MNIASINYYFRSGRTLASAPTLTINHMLEDVQFILATLPILQAHPGNFFIIYWRVMRFPGVSIAHLYSAIGINNMTPRPGIVKHFICR
jgi:hypothetical protein